ncbi:DUF6653 family protein [Salinilacihabitans rarus]|uniref:DUF6653 family protein n=1 Tax=Salinilacihabitans rarus TaxID=2961596 RepID=UPI0020C8644E|nr:DUF6653 family protein [Salinilacihabitans rarus]
MTTRESLAERFRARHANPWSGYTRSPLGPAPLFALYRRGRRLVGSILPYVAIDPVLVPEPETTDAWISRSVLGEKRRLAGGHGVFEATGPGTLTRPNAVAYCYGPSGADERSPRATGIGATLAPTGKPPYPRRMVNYYDERSKGLGEPA